MGPYCEITDRAHHEHLHNEIERLRAEKQNVRDVCDEYREKLGLVEDEVERLAGIVTVERVARKAEVERLQRPRCDAGEDHVPRAEVERLRAWGQQVHDALDGKPLPELPDEAPARIERLRAENYSLNLVIATLEDDVANSTPNGEVERLQESCDD